jgi:glycosyltransferase involved in cell wall biosynthesis
MSASPQVTVIILVYNREKYISEAIESILAQSFTDFELLLIDDGSTDGSVEIMGSYTDPRVRLVCNEGNLGIPKTRNKGIRLARGAYLAVLDSDDYAYPDRLARQVAFLDRHKDYAAVGSWTVAMDEKDQSLRRIKRLPVSPGEVQSRLLFRCCLCHSALMARKAILHEYWYRDQYVVCEDVDLFVRIARKHKLGNLPEVLTCIRGHAGRITREKAQLVKDKNLDIVSAQLTELGVMFTDTDLERHFLLSHMNKLQFIPDREYLEWAGAWLLKLQEANQHALRYPERPFSRVVGGMWLKVCRRASAGLGWTAWKRFWQSPLSTGALSGLRQNLFLFAFRRSLGDA